MVLVLVSIRIKHVSKFTCKENNESTRSKYQMFLGMCTKLIVKTPGDIVLFANLTQIISALLS